MIGYRVVSYRAINKTV